MQNVELTPVSSAPRKSRRRWFQFSLRTLLIVSCLAGVVISWPHLYRRYQMQQLAEYAGKDIRNLSNEEQSKVTQLLGDLIPGLIPEDDMERQLQSIIGFDTWYIWQPKSGEPTLIIFQGARLFSIPGASEARVFFLNDGGKVTYQNAFRVLYRGDIEDASFHEPAAGFPYVRIRSERSIHGRSIRWQYYAVTKNGVELVRLENEQDQIIPIARAHGPGPELAPVSVKQWAEWLISNDRIVQLRALGTMPTDASKLVGDKQVKNRLTALASSDDQWVSEAAAAYSKVLENPKEFWWFGK